MTFQYFRLLPIWAICLNFLILETVHAQGSLPDFSIQKYFNTPLRAVPGYPFVYTYNLVYQGAPYTDSLAINFYLSSDTILTSSDLLLKSTQFANTQSLAYNNLQQNLILPADISTGNYYLFLFADPTNKIPESNELNNLFYSKLNVATPLVDLEISALSYNLYQPAYSGLAYPVSTTLFNAGLDSCPASQISFFLSEDTIFQLSDMLISEAAAPAFRTGYQNMVVNSSLTIPAQLSSGIYFLFAVADPKNLIHEQNEVNNIFRTDLEILKPEFDFVLSNFHANKDSGAQGEVILLMDSITNTTGYASLSMLSLPFSVFLSVDTIFDATKDKLVGNYAHDFNGRSPVTDTTNFLVPTVTPGTYYLFIEINPNSVIGEFNKENNFGYLSLKILPSDVDLIASKATVLTDTIISGETYKISFDVSNIGTTQASYAYSSAFFSMDSIYDYNDQSLNGGYSQSLDPGKSGKITSNGYIPGNLATGYYYILSYADYDKNVRESNDSNNVTITKIKVYAPRFAILLNKVSVKTTSVNRGNWIDIDFAVQNVGNADPNYFIFSCYLTADTLPNGNEISLGFYNYDKAFPGGASVHLDTMFHIPKVIAPAKMLLGCSVDYADWSANRGKSSNVVYLPIEVMESTTELTIPQITVQKNLIAGQVVKVAYSVKNTGSTHADIPDIAYYLSSDSTYIASPNLLLAQLKAVNVPGSGSVQGSSSFKIPLNVPAGDYFLLGYINNNQQTKETNYFNNFASQKITISSPAYDLSLSNAAVAVNSPLPYLVINVETKFSITTPVQMDSVKVRYLVSADTIFSKDDFLVDSTLFVTLPRDTVFALSRFLSIPYNYNLKLAFVLIQVNGLSYLTESNIANNIVFKKIPNGAVFPDLTIKDPRIYPNFLREGGKIKYSFLVAEDFTFANNSVAKVYLSEDSVFNSREDTLIRSFGVPYLSLHENWSINDSIQFGNLYPGKYYLIFIADADNVVYEEDETNNFQTLSFVVADSASKDVAISNLISPGTISSFGTILSAVTVDNFGIDTIDHFTISVYLFNSFDSAKTKVGQADIAQLLLPGDSMQIQVPLRITPVANGEYYLEAIIDEGNPLQESDLDNNISKRPIVVSSIAGSSLAEETTGFQVLSNENTETIVITFNDHSFAGNQIVLYHSTGKAVWSSRVADEDVVNGVIISSGLLAKGIYFLHIDSEHGDSTKKILVY